MAAISDNLKAAIILSLYHLIIMPLYSIQHYNPKSQICYSMHCEL